MRLLLIMAFIVSSLLRSINASEHEPMYEKFKEQFQKPYFKIGFLQQTVLDFQPQRNLSGKNGFSLANYRLKLSGEFDAGFGYALQTRFTRSPAMLDARIFYRIRPNLAIHAGLYKSPFSEEYLISAANIDFVNRSRVVSALAPGRQIGIMAEGQSKQNFLTLQAGMFNGNGMVASGNENNHFLYVARIVLKKQIPFKNYQNAEVKLGANVAYSQDSLLTFSSLNLTRFVGDRRIYGLDTRITCGDFLLAGEYLWARFSTVTGKTISPSGFYVTAGKMLSPKWQILLRWDSFHADKNVKAGDLMILGINFWPTSIAELQFNYIVNTEDSALKHHQILLNFQISI